MRAVIQRTQHSSVTVDGGPMFKRLRPRARGMAYVIRRRMSHIGVKLIFLLELVSPFVECILYFNL